MKHWLALAAAVSSASLGFSQVPPKVVPGVMIIRVKVNGPGGPGPMGLLPPPPDAQPMPGGDAAGDLRSVVVAVPFKNLYQDVVYAGKPFNAQTNPKGAFWLSHEFGRTLLFTDSNRVQLTPQFDLNPDVILKAKHAEWAKKPNVEGLYDLIALALTYDQVETALAYSQQLVRTVEAKKDIAPPQRVADFVALFKDLAAKFDETLPVAGEVVEWKKRLQAAASAEDKHYSVVHFGDQSVQADVLAGKMAQMERNYKGFFLWHAVTGRKVPTPAKKQIVILAKRGADLPGLRAQLDGSPIVSDAFYVPSHNVVVLSPERLDDAGRSYLEMMKAEYDTGWIRDSLLKGIAPKLSEKVTYSDIFRMSTNALVDRAMEVEGNQGSVSRECNRQLFASCGVIPQHVVLPKWLDQGLAALLNKPKNPGVVLGGAPDKHVMVYGYSAGYGSPNYVLFREWKNLKARQELPLGLPAAAQSEANMEVAAKSVLMGVLNESYFAAARSGIDFDKPAEGPGTAVPPPPPPPPFGAPPREGGVTPLPGQDPTTAENPGIELSLKARLELKAQATSWALVYFLSRERPDGLKKYCAELDRLPRDMRLDKKLGVEVFAKSFDLMNAELTEVNDAAVKDFAMKWVKYLDATQTSWRDLPVEATANVAPPAGPIPGVN